MDEKRIAELAENRLSVMKAIRIAVNEALSDAAIQVFMVRQESEMDDADDKGVSGWLQDAENRINALKLS